jgi:UDP-N-acetyl-D-galactosamine dehydrogenase
LILAVPHQEYMSDPARLFACLREGGVFIDVKSAMAGSTLPSGIAYWSL